MLVQVSRIASRRSGKPASFFYMFLASRFSLAICIVAACQIFTRNTPVPHDAHSVSDPTEWARWMPD